MAAEDYEDEPMPYDASDKVAEGAESEGHDRVAKVLARAGVGSRREVERLIEAGRVAINGLLLTTPAIKVEPDDILTVDGEVIAGAEATRVFRYHKPVGLVTTHADPKGRPTVFSALPDGLPRLISVGRLDLASEGLLLLTNDGGLTRALELPSTGWKRIYRARAFGDASQAKLDRLKDGITVEGIRYGAIEAKLDKVTGSNCWITVTLAEGKNREVRRVLEAIGLKVNRLIRLAYGPFSLGTLAPGFVEEVGPRVIREMLGEYIDPANMPTGNGVQYKAPPQAQAQSRRDPTVGSTSKVLAEPKPEKPVYKAGWAKPKKKAVSHVMPKRPKAKVVADFGPGKREIKPVTFRGNAPKTDADRVSKSYKTPAAPAGKPPPKDLRPQHFKDREAAAAAEDAKALALRKALAGLDDGPKKGPRPGGKPFGKPAGKFAGKPGEKPVGKAGDKPARSLAGKPEKAAKPLGRHLEGKAKGHWFTAPGEAPSSRPVTGPPPKGKGGKPRPAAAKPAGGPRKGR